MPLHYKKPAHYFAEIVRVLSCKGRVEISE